MFSHFNTLPTCPSWLNFRLSVGRNYMYFYRYKYASTHTVRKCILHLLLDYLNLYLITRSGVQTHMDIPPIDLKCNIWSLPTQFHSSNIISSTCFHSFQIKQMFCTNSCKNCNLHEPTRTCICWLLSLKP